MGSRAHQQHYVAITRSAFVQQAITPFILDLPDTDHPGNAGRQRFSFLRQPQILGLDFRLDQRVAQTLAQWALLVLGLAA